MSIASSASNWRHMYPIEGARNPAASAITASRQRTAIARSLRRAEIVVVAFSCATGAVIRFGAEDWHSAWGGPAVSYGLLGLGIALTWLLALCQQGTTDPKIIGSGITPFRRVVTATAVLLAAVAVFQLVTGLSVTRGMLTITVGSGLIGLLLVHHIAGLRLRRLWQHGRGVARTLVVAPADRREVIMSSLADPGEFGYEVVDWLDADDLALSAIAGHNDPCAACTTIREAALSADADVVLLTDASQLGPTEFRDLSWDLHELGIGLIVEPAVQDVALARMQVNQVNGLTLLHIDQPTYRGAVRFQKRVFDTVFAAASLLVLAPVMLATMLLVKLEDRGPVLYRATRVGLGGTPFRMLKFRSMVTDADAQLATVREASGTADDAFYKDPKDPRITRVGRFIRRTSIDELPQLINVLRGDMSIVGPRPMVADEGQEYRDFVRRRVLVRPGITGLWQVSGRSEITDDERVRLDLNYVENWSLAGDLSIVGRTVGTVLRQEGAY